jgi:type II secretion system protein N
MPPKLKSNRWRVIVGYVAYGLVALVFCFYLTFPYDAMKLRLVSEAANLGFDMKLGKLGPAWLGIGASSVQIAKKTESNEEPGPSVVLRSLSLHPSLFPPGLAFRAKLFGGTVTGAVGGLGDLAIRADVNDLDAGDPSVKLLSGLDLGGRVSSHVSLTIPKGKATPAAKNPESDLSQASGNVSLKLDQFLVKGGALSLPLYGSEPMPVDVPRLALGNVECKIKFDKGLGKIEKLQGKGDDVELMASGTVKLAKRLDYSDTNVDLKFKSEAGLIKTLSEIARLPKDKENADFRTARITGFLGRPNFNPGR